MHFRCSEWRKIKWYANGTLSYISYVWFFMSFSFMHFFFFFLLLCLLFYCSHARIYSKWIRFDFPLTSLSIVCRAKKGTLTAKFKSCMHANINKSLESRRPVATFFFSFLKLIYTKGKVQISNQLGCNHKCKNNIEHVNAIFNSIKLS